jgi:hypothetical protein
MVEMSPGLVESALAEMPFPARRWEIVTWAEFNGAVPALVTALSCIPDWTYTDARMVHTAAARSEAPKPVELCSHRRHPKHCPKHMGHNWPHELRAG